MIEKLNTKVGIVEFDNTTGYYKITAYKEELNEGDD